MASFKSLCEKYFGSNNFYEILQITSSASEKEIKKAYHRLSLHVHPDRVTHDQKEIATEKFKVLGKIHSILQNKEKRKRYDDVGEFDYDMDTSYNWMDYWRNMFKKIELKDIQEYEKEYVGSETEYRDIKKAYEGSRGNMDSILEMVPFSNCDSEPRIIEIVQKMVDNGEVESYNTFFNESKQRKLRRKRKWELEKKQAEKIEMNELEKEMDKSMKERAANFENFMNDLEAKYAPKSKQRKSITDGSRSNKKRKSK
ncbi:dnaJ homolog subfamily C member 9 [Diabrotica virgifera virgifera]|uniref:DnaJ homolog subfamily C member 9 n=1 Tax=Diabrotica virgifera virgifera TaxID=50390 RepID=A0A6P7FCH5_DIAVI|nr:dnaJ homolog subfamily C member 9 [Diabrotica virgifera virgifera]